MKKKFIAILIAGMLLISGILGEKTVSAAQQEKEAAMESISEKMPGGYRKLIEVELDEDNLPETYVRTDVQTYAKGANVYNSFWDAYSTNYYYNQLDVNESALWDKLDEMCLGYLTGTEDLTEKDHYKDLEYGMDFDYYYTRKVHFSKLSKKEALEVTSMFVFSNPQYYFLQSLWGCTPVGNGGYVTLTVHDDFAKGSVRKQITEELNQKIKNWLTEITTQPTDLLKEKKAHDLICEKVSYDSTYGTLSQNEFNQSIYSVFFTDTTVCAGYSQTMQLLCNGVGINCCVVTSETHEWNIVEINDTWYYVDCTWDDFSDKMVTAYNQEMGYKYFNRSAAAFADDTSVNVQSHTLENMWKEYLPELMHDSGATWLEYGTVHEPNSTVSMPQIFINGSQITLKSEAGAKIYYTTDGSIPEEAAAKAVKYTESFTLKQAANLRVIAVSTGKYDSSVATVGIPVSQRKGYALLGWYTNNKNGTRITENMPLTSGSTIYAKWAKIKGKKAIITSLKNKKKKKLLVKVKPIHTANGYQIRYSLKKSMKSAKKVNSVETQTLIKKLKKGKKYYLQVRMYQVDSVSGNKKYGAWSKIKSIRIKK